MATKKKKLKRSLDIFEDLVEALRSENGDTDSFDDVMGRLENAYGDVITYMERK